MLPLRMLQRRCSRRNEWYMQGQRVSRDRWCRVAPRLGPLGTPQRVCPRTGDTVTFELGCVEAGVGNEAQVGSGAVRAWYAAEELGPRSEGDHES